MDAPRIAALAEQFGAHVGAARRRATELDGLDRKLRARRGAVPRRARARPRSRRSGDPQPDSPQDGSVGRRRPRARCPTPDLQAWLDANADRYAAPARYDLEQVFFDPERRGARLTADIDAALRGLEGEPAADPTAFGDATLLPAELRDVTRMDVAAQFGEELAAELADAPLDRWFGPVSSGYGAHLVRVDCESRQRPRRSRTCATRSSATCSTRELRPRTTRFTSACALVTRCASRSRRTACSKPRRLRSLQ